MSDEAVRFVAEHVMGFQRKECQGSVGGGSQDDGGTTRLWFICEWCGREIRKGEIQGFCPKQPFPRFLIEDVMRKMAQQGIDILLRADIKRNGKVFTLVGPKGRICDTDIPFEALCEYLEENYFSLHVDVTRQHLQERLAQYKDTLVLDGFTVVRLEGLDLEQDDGDFYWEFRHLSGEKVLTSCVMRFVPLKGKLDNEDYEYLERAFRLNLGEID